MEDPPWMKMYFLLYWKWGFSNVILVFRAIYLTASYQTHLGFQSSKKSPPTIQRERSRSQELHPVAEIVPTPWVGSSCADFFLVVAGVGSCCNPISGYTKWWVWSWWYGVGDIYNIWIWQYGLNPRFGIGDLFDFVYLFLRGGGGLIWEREREMFKLRSLRKAEMMQFSLLNKTKKFPVWPGFWNGLYYIL